RCSNHGSWAAVGPIAERENPAIRSANIEPVRVGIGGWIAIGCGKHHQNGVAFRHLHAENIVSLREKASGILNRRIKSENLRDGSMKEFGTNRDAVTQFRVASQYEQSVPYQTCGRLIRLRHKADCISKHDFPAERAHPCRLSIQGEEQALRG